MSMDDRLSTLRNKISEYQDGTGEISLNLATAQQPEQAREEEGKTTLIEQVKANGNRPEDWLDLTHFARENSDVFGLRSTYREAFKAIPEALSKNNQAYAQLLVDQATLIAEDDADDGEENFKLARHKARKFAFVHVAAAQFELSQGRKEKARTILEKAKEVKAQPVEMILHAFREFIHGKSVLLTAHDRATIENTYMKQDPLKVQSPSEQNKENTYEPIEPRHSWMPNPHPTHTTGKDALLPVEELLVPRRAHADRAASKAPIPTVHVGSAMKIGSFVRDTPLLKKTSGGISTTKHLGLLGSANPTRKMYTDVIERGDSDDSSAFHFPAKPPLNKERKIEVSDNTVSFGKTHRYQSGPESGGDDTVPLHTGGGGEYHAQQGSRLRSFNSTPDCKAASILSSVTRPGQSSTQRKKMPLFKAQRVPVEKIKEYDEDVWTPAHPRRPHFSDSPEAKKLDDKPVYMDTDISPDQVDSGHATDSDPPPVVKRMWGRDTAVTEMRKLNFCNDSGVIQGSHNTAELDPVKTGSSTCSSDNSTLKTTATQMNIQPSRNAPASSSNPFRIPPPVQQPPKTQAMKYTPPSGTIPTQSTYREKKSPPDVSPDSLHNAQQSTKARYNSQWTEPQHQAATRKPLAEIASSSAQQKLELIGGDKQYMSAYKPGFKEIHKSVLSDRKEGLLSEDQKPILSEQPPKALLLEQPQRQSQPKPQKQQSHPPPLPSSQPQPKPEQKEQEKVTQHPHSQVASGTASAVDPMPAPPSLSVPSPFFQSQGIIYTVNNQHYQAHQICGKGGTCEVWHCMAENNQAVAVKIVKFGDHDRAAIKAYENEIRIMEKLQHSSRVIKLYNYEFKPAEKTLYIVMEKGDADLNKVFQNRLRQGDLSPHMRRFYWSEMLQAVQALHAADIVHADLKPANFLLVAGSIKLIDFGIAHNLDTDKTSITIDQQVGTLNYISPEAINDLGNTQSSREDGQPYRPTIKIGKKCDVWSLGCILYLMTYMKTPFYAIKPQMKVNAILSESFPIPFPPIKNQNLLDTMKRCLVRDVKKRASIQELLDHDYLQA